MKRRESKFVAASPRLAPEQIKAAPRLREDRARPLGSGVRQKTPRIAVTVRRPQARKRS